jgi:dCMP deaminase
MILIIACDNRTVEEQVISYLQARSVHPIIIGDTDIKERIGDLDPARHYALFGIKNISRAEAALNPGSFRTAVIGHRPLSSPHCRIAADDPNLFSKIETFAVEAMSAFKRPGWDEYFMEIAKVVGRRANCMKRQVASVVVKDRRIVATGYNGTPRGAKNCNEGGCPRCNGLAESGSALDECLCNHAEENAVAQAAYHGISIRGATIYCTYSPCLRCTKLIINAGIETVIFNARYELDDTSLSLLKECGIEVRGILETI